MWIENAILPANGAFQEQPIWIPDGSGPIIRTNFTIWDASEAFMYDDSPDPEIDLPAQAIVITGGVGWTPGTYTITARFFPFGTQTGSHNMVMYSGGQAAARATNGGIGYLTY